MTKRRYKDDFEVGSHSGAYYMKKKKKTNTKTNMKTAPNGHP
jgi:hypothetical protein